MAHLRATRGATRVPYRARSAAGSDFPPARTVAGASATTCKLSISPNGVRSRHKADERGDRRQCLLSGGKADIDQALTSHPLLRAKQTSTHSVRSAPEPS